MLDDDYTDEQKSRIAHLCDRYVADSISPSEGEELLQWLEKDPGLADLLCEHLMLQLELKAIYDPFRYEEPSPNPLDELAFRIATETMAAAATKSSPTVSARGDEEHRGKPKKKYSGGVWFCVLAILAGCLVVAYEYDLFRGSADPEIVQKENPFKPIATVSETVDVVWPENTIPLKRGQELESGNISFLSGILELTLQSGVRIALEGPVDFRLNSPSNTFCSQGNLSVTVPIDARGFEVATPLLTVVDLGTEFSLAVGEDGIETHTISGKVELTRLPEGKTELTEGAALRVNPQGRSKRFSADPFRFLTWRDVRRKADEAGRIFLEKWRQSQAEWNKDPALLVHFDFEDDGKNLINRAVHGRQIVSAGFIDGPVRSDGRCPGKNGLLFKKRDDAVAVNVPGEVDSLTFFASVRIDALRRHNQVLFASSSSEGGSFSWQLPRGGAILLACSDGRKTATYEAPWIVQRNLWGAWYTIATVLDRENGRVSHYFDGKLVGTGPIRQDVRFPIGEATLGNGFQKTDNVSDSSFDGCIDQFLLFGRPLEEAEIVQLHESSKTL